MTWNVTRKSAQNDIASERRKTIQKRYKISTPSLDDHHFEKEKLETFGDLSKVCSQFVLKCLYLDRMGGPDIRWSANKLPWAVTKWTRACDWRLARLISYFHRHHCHLCNTAQHCRLVYSKTQIRHFAGDLEDSKSASWESFVSSDVERLFQEAGCAKKQTSVLHRSTETKVISLDADETRVQNPQSCVKQVVWQNRCGPPRIPIKYVDTKNQFADMMTKGKVTRDEWDHLLRLFQHHEFLDVFLQPFFFQSKHQRTSGEELLAAKSKPGTLISRSLSAETIFHVGFRYIIKPGELQIGLEFWSHKRWEIGAREGRKLIVEFSSVAQRWHSKFREIGTRDESAFKHWETGARSTESTHRGKVAPPQSSGLRLSIHWERLHECSKVVGSSWRRPDAGPKGQCTDMVVIYVNNDESSDTSRRRSQRELVANREH